MSSVESYSPLSTRVLIPPWLTGRWGIVGVALALYLLVFLAWTHFHWGGMEHVTLIGNLAILPPILLAVFMAWRVAKQSTLTQGLRRVWLILGLSFLMNFIGNIVWTYLENVLHIEPFPSIADLFYLGSYPLMLWGLLTLPGAPQDRRERLIFWLDLIIVLAGASMFVGYFLIVPTAAINNSDLLTQALATAYPIWSLVLLAGLVSLLYRRPSADAQAVSLLLLTGTAFFLASDFAFGYTSLAGTYRVGSWVDVGWNIAQLFFVLAAFRQLHQGAVPAAKHRGVNVLDRLAYLLPFAAAILSYGLVLYVTLTNFGPAAERLFITAVFLTALILVRQIFGPGFSVASVRTKLILTFLLVSVLSVGLVTFFAYITLRSDLESPWETLLLTTLIVLVLTTGAALLLAQLFVAPISRLTAVAAQIAAGNLSTKAQVEARDEIGTLAETFNTMLDALLRALAEQAALAQSNTHLLAELERQKGDLGIRVEQRTTELNTLNRRLQQELAERQRLVHSLSDSEARFHLLFAASPDAILLIDPYDPETSWSIVDCNEVACAMNGYRREELIGQSIDILNESPADSTERRDYLERVRQKGILHYEAFHRHKAGHLFPVEVSTSLITFAGRELVLGIDRNITERKQTEMALQQAKEIAEAASGAKSEFLSRMSHELRTPMNAILGFAQLLNMSRKEPLTPTQKERVRQITKGGQHLLGLINEILDISRIEAGHLQISPEPVPIRESIQEVLDLTAPLAADRHIQLQTSLEAEARPYVMADRQRLKQVLLNLLSNAVKYNYEGGYVLISCEHTGEANWRISITDTGTGISAENMGRLFKPFERLVDDWSNVEGTGLGLALAKRLVQLMEGRIGVESVVGQGSTFWVELPSAESQLERLQRTGGTGQLPLMSPTARTILYIEDNIANFELIQQVLADYDQIELLWAADPQTGIESARLHLPNVILLDLHLGGRDGSEVLMKLKQDAQTAAIPVVIVSADAIPGQIERMISLGAHSYLTKPLDVKQFIQLIEELLSEEEI